MATTIRLRLTLWYTGLVLLLLAMLGGITWAAVSRGLYRALEQEMERVAVLIAEEEASQIVRGDTGPLIARHDRHLLAVGLEVQILGPNHRILERSANLENASLPLLAEALRTKDEQTVTQILPEGERLRVHYHPLRIGDQIVATVQVAHPLSDVDRARSQLAWTLLLATPFVGLASLGLGLFLADRAMRPIADITAAARAIGAGDLHRRIALAGADDELKSLADTFDEMLARLEQTFAAQREFIADASHELRTPLTILRGHLEVLLRAPTWDEAEARDTLVLLSDEVTRMNRLAEDLLLLAQADAGVLTMAHEPVELVEFLDEVYQAAKVLAGGRRLTLECLADPIILGDVDRLRQLFLNLVDNAIKHTSDDGTVHLRLRANDTQALLTVTDDGPGIPPEHLPHIFDRFYRADKARSRALGGAGLGLSIAHRIAAMHGGDLTASSVLGQGTTFTVRFPVPPQETV